MINPMETMINATEKKKKKEDKDKELIWHN